MPKLPLKQVDPSGASDGKVVEFNSTSGNWESGDQKVMVSSNDTTPDYLLSKVLGDGITITEDSDGGDENVKFTVAPNASYVIPITPANLITPGLSSEVDANDYPALEFRPGKSDFGIWSNFWQF